MIERFAARLESRAVAVRRGGVAVGAALGALFGSVPLTPLHVAWPVPQFFGFATVMIGAAAGALIGWVVGDGRAELHRLHAQTMLSTLHAQRTSLAIWRLLERREQEQPAAVAPPPPVPEPEVEPEPQPVAPPPPVLAAAPPVAVPVPVSLAVPVSAVPEPDPEPEPEAEPEPVPVTALREATAFASAPPALRQAGPYAPPITPPPLTG